VELTFQPKQNRNSSIRNKKKTLQQNKKKRQRSYFHFLSSLYRQSKLACFDVLKTNVKKKKDNVHIFIFSHRFTAKVNSLVLMYLKQTLKKG